MSALATAEHNGSRRGEPEPPKQPEDLYDQFMALAPRAQEHLAALDREREELDRRHQSAVAELEAKKRKIKAVLKALGEEPPRRTRQSANKAKGKPSDTIMASVLETVLAEEELFTVLGIHETSGATWSTAHTRVGMDVLRDSEVIGKVRKEAGKGGRFLFRVLDREAGEQMLASLRAANA